VLSLRFKPVNADHGLETRALVALFEESHGASYPYPEVYNEHFWKTRINRDFTSLVALQKNKIVAHIGLRFEAQGRADAHLLFIAIHPEWSTQAGEILNQLWQLGANCRRWPEVYGIHCAMPFPHQAIDEFLSDVIGLRFVSLLPQYGKTESGRHTLALYSRAKQHPLPAPKMRIPQALSEYAQKVYAQFGITPEFVSNTKPQLRAISADVQAVEQVCNHSLGVEQLLISPSLAKAQLELSDSSLRKILYIDARDPLCSEVITEAEEKGYSFSGFAPFLRGRHYVVMGSHPVLEQASDISNSALAPIFASRGSRAQPSPKNRGQTSRQAIAI
jgi:hypothetical protein